MLRGAARRLSRRALRAAGAPRAPLPAVEALCPPALSAETAARWRGPPCCARGFSASGPPPGGEAPPPPGAGATPAAPPPPEGDASETKKHKENAKTPKETPEVRSPAARRDRSTRGRRRVPQGLPGVRAVRVQARACGSATHAAFRGPPGVRAERDATALGQLRRAALVRY